MSAQHRNLSGPWRQFHLVAENLASQKREATQQRRHQMRKRLQEKHDLCCYLVVHQPRISGKKLPVTLPTPPAIEALFTH